MGLFAIGTVAFSFGLAALAIWLLVRVINRRRRISATFWAVGVLAMIVAYPLSFGPACWVNERTDANTGLISAAFYPIIRLANRSSRVSAMALWYAALGAREGSTPSFYGDEIGWWVEGPGSMVPYRAIISCYYSVESGDWTCEVSSDGTEDEAAH